MNGGEPRLLGGPPTPILNYINRPIFEDGTKVGELITKSIIMNESEKKCTTCGGKTTGYKCDMCGAEAIVHDDDHACGGDHCVAKCAACKQAETKCTCS